MPRVLPWLNALLPKPTAANRHLRHCCGRLHLIGHSHSALEASFRGIAIIRCSLSRSKSPYDPTFDVGADFKVSVAGV